MNSRIQNLIISLLIYLSITNCQITNTSSSQKLAAREKLIDDAQNELTEEIKANQLKEYLLTKQIDDAEEDVLKRENLSSKLSSLKQKDALINQNDILIDNREGLYDSEQDSSQKMSVEILNKIIAERKLAVAAKKETNKSKESTVKMLMRLVDAVQKDYSQKKLLNELALDELKTLNLQFNTLNYKKNLLSRTLEKVESYLPNPTDKSAESLEETEMTEAEKQKILNNISMILNKQSDIVLKKQDVLEHAEHQYLHENKGLRKADLELTKKENKLNESENRIIKKLEQLQNKGETSGDYQFNNQESSLDQLEKIYDQEEAIIQQKENMANKVIATDKANSNNKLRLSNVLEDSEDNYQKKIENIEDRAIILENKVTTNSFDKEKVVDKMKEVSQKKSDALIKMNSDLNKEKSLLGQLKNDLKQLESDLTKNGFKKAEKKELDLKPRFQRLDNVDNLIEKANTNIKNSDTLKNLERLNTKESLIMDKLNLIRFLKEDLSQKALELKKENAVVKGSMTQKVTLFSFTIDKKLKILKEELEKLNESKSKDTKFFSQQIAIYTKEIDVLNAATKSIQKQYSRYNSHNDIEKLIELENDNFIKKNQISTNFAEAKKKRKSTCKTKK